MRNAEISGNKVERYEIYLKDNESCYFLVEECGLIYVKNMGVHSINDMARFLEEITKVVEERGRRPQIRIVKSNYYLQCLAQRCNYEKIPSDRDSFDIWVHR